MSPTRSGAKIATRSADQVRGYFERLSPAARKRLKDMRSIIRSVAPQAEEGISYGIPALKLDGRPFVYYAAFKNHTSIYPMTEGIKRAHAAALEGYEMSKGTIRFPLDAPLPAALLKRLVKARLAELRPKGKR